MKSVRSIHDGLRECAGYLLNWNVDVLWRRDCCPRRRDRCSWRRNGCRDVRRRRFERRRGRRRKLQGYRLCSAKGWRRTRGRRERSGCGLSSGGSGCAASVCLHRWHSEVLRACSVLQFLDELVSLREFLCCVIQYLPIVGSTCDEGFELCLSGVASLDA